MVLMPHQLYRTHDCDGSFRSHARWCFLKTRELPKVPVGDIFDIFQVCVHISWFPILPGDLSKASLKAGDSHVRACMPLVTWVTGYIVLGDAWPQIAEYTPCHSSVEFADAILPEAIFMARTAMLKP